MLIFPVDKLFVTQCHIFVTLWSRRIPYCFLSKVRTYKLGGNKNCSGTRKYRNVHLAPVSSCKTWSKTLHNPDSVKAWNCGTVLLIIPRKVWSTLTNESTVRVPLLSSLSIEKINSTISHSWIENKRERGRRKWFEWNHLTLDILFI